jgi:exonuclease III
MMKKTISISRIVWLSTCLVLLLYSLSDGKGISILNYNVNAIEARGTDGREALQRIVDYLDPDIIIFQEARGTKEPNDFLAYNSDYEGFYSQDADGAGNRLMIMSKYDIIDESVREYFLGEGSLRPLYAATIDIPGSKDLEVFTAHWNASDPNVRENESNESVAIIGAYRAAHPSAFYIYAGDLNEEDTSFRIIRLLDPNVGLNLTSPVDLNNGSNATINSDPNKGTYLDRRIDYVLPSDKMLPFFVYGRILNTWSYTIATIPQGLTLTDTINASDHLPVFVYFDLPEIGDIDGNHYVDFADMALFANYWQQTNCGLCGGADLTGDGNVDWYDLREFCDNWLESYLTAP